jgi:hypothetical protein
MATFGPPAEGGTCRGCGQEFAHLPKGTTDQLCRGCTEVADEADRLLAQADRLVEVELMDAGLEDRERGATVDRIPPEIRRRLPPTIVRGMVAGELPERGFGLSGTSGIGKTMALSAIVKQYAMARLQRIARAGEFKRARGWLAWVPWKATTETVRALSMEERGHAEVNRLMERYARAEVLVLDDLGAERIRGNYADDWATSQLDRIVDLRDRKMLPLWYTSNLDAAALQKFYGSRLWSRLCGIAPLVELGSGPDLRLRRESADVGERPKNR